MFAKFEQTGYTEIFRGVHLKTPENLLSSTDQN